MKLWKKISIGSALVIIVVLVILYFSFSILGVPYVKSIESRWGNVSSNQTEILTEVTIENPNLFDITISSLYYEIYLNNITIAEGWDKDINLEHGTTILNYMTTLNVSKIPQWWSSHINNNETTIITIRYKVFAKLGPIHKTQTIKYEYNTIHTNLLSKLKLNEPKEIIVSIPNEPELHLLTVTGFSPKWDLINEDITIINTSLVLYNPHSTTIEVVFFNYEFIMNNFTVGWGYLASPATIPPGSAVVVNCDTIIDNKNIIDWFSSHIKNGEFTQYQIKSSANFVYEGASYLVEPINLTGEFYTNLLG